MNRVDTPLTRELQHSATDRLLLPKGNFSGGATLEEALFFLRGMWALNTDNPDCVVELMSSNLTQPPLLSYS